MTDDNSKKNFPVYLFFFIITLCKGFDLQSDSKIYLGLYIIAFILLICKIFTDKYTLKELFMCGSLLAICTLILFVSKNPTPLFFAISICCLKNVNIKKIIKIIFYTKLFSTITMITLSSIGIIENEYFYHVRDGIEITKRYCFGYLHPNIVQIQLFLLICMFDYLYEEKINAWTIIIITAINIILYHYTVSRTSFYLIILFLFYRVLAKKIDFIKKNAYKIAKYGFILFFVISITVALLYSYSPIIRKLDLLLTGRIYYCKELITNFLPPLIGNTSYGNILFDNSYFYLIYQGGIIFTALIIFLMYKLSNYLEKEKKYKELELIFFMSILCFNENAFLNVTANFTILFLGYIIFDNIEMEEINHVK